MKKLVNYLFMLVLIIACTITTVNASDLSKLIETNVKDLFGENGKITTSYDKENDITDVLVTVTADGNTEKKILSQIPGKDEYSILGNGYMMLKPNTGYTIFNKQNAYFTKDTTESIESQKEKVLNRIDASDLVNVNAGGKEAVWPIAVMVQYYDTVQGKWVKSGDKPDGKTVVKNNLMNKLGITNERDLKYGENYRIAMYTQYYWLNVWQEVDENGEPTGREEWIRTNYEIKFPVSSVIGKNIAYYPTLFDATKSEGNEIILTKDYITSEKDTNVVIPDDTKLTINEDVTLKITNGSSVTVKGIDDINNNGKIIIEGTLKDSNDNEIYTITVKDAAVSANLAKKDDKITVVPEKRNGYTAAVSVKNLKNDQEIEVVDNKFTMPEANVSVEVKYTEVKLDTNIPVLNEKDDVKEVTVAVSNKEETQNILLDSLKNTDFYDASKDYDVQVEIKAEDVNKMDKNIISSIKEVVEKNVEDGVVAYYFDITLGVYSDNAKVGNLSELSNKITLSVALPKELQNKQENIERKYYIVRYHDGKADLIETKVSEDGKTLTFESEKFSNYALIYKDTKTKVEEEIESPKTLDNVGIYMIMSLVSVIGLGGSIKFITRMN